MVTVVMLSFLYAKCPNAECRYSECRYAECCYAEYYATCPNASVLILSVIML